MNRSICGAFVMMGLAAVGCGATGASQLSPEGDETVGASASAPKNADASGDTPSGAGESGCAANGYVPTACGAGESRKCFADPADPDGALAAVELPEGQGTTCWIVRTP
jgi:hypothetical protein